MQAVHEGDGPVKLGIELSGDRPVVVLGAHADDIEIGAGGTLLQLSHDHPESRFVFAVAAADAERSSEAIASARDLLGDRAVVQVGGFEDGFLPYADPTGVKRWLRSAVESTPPSLVFSPWAGDEHQDHRFMGQLAWQIFRGSTILEYEIPKWEGEPFVPNLLIPLTEETARAKLAHLDKSFPSQHGKPWYDMSLFSSSRFGPGVCSMARARTPKVSSHESLLWRQAPRAANSPGEDAVRNRHVWGDFMTSFSQRLNGASALGTCPGDGSQGYIGSVLVQHLRSHGYDVVEKDLGLYVECRYPSGAIEPLGWDVREAMPADFQGVDAVVHLAALSNDPLGDLDPALTYEINHDGTMRVAEAARDAGVKRFVFAVLLLLWGPPRPAGFSTSRRRWPR